MDNIRLFTWGLFGLTLFMAWQAWQLDYAPTPTPATVGDDIAVPAEPTEPATEIPELGAAESPRPAPDLDDVAPVVATTATIRVRTDVLELEIDPRGASIVGARVLDYPVRKDDPNQVITLLGTTPGDIGMVRSGLSGGGDHEDPTHTTLYTVAATEYTLGDADELIVPLTYSRDDGLTVTKTYRLTRGSYRIDLDFVITNDTAEAYAPSSYVQIVRTERSVERSMFDVDSYSFQGPVLHNGDTYEKYDFDDFDEADRNNRLTTTGGWLATIRHHFLTAAIPPEDETWVYWLGREADNYVVTMIARQPAIAAGATGVYPVTLFVGPKLQDQLEEIAPSLKLTVDYGILTVLAQPLFWLLSKVHDVVGNWGWAIVIVTIVIKLVFYKLTATSGRSMAKMRELQPRLKQIQERYKDDRQKLSQAMMDLYKREKVNPAAGCLPILVQMPFFLAFYWVLLESVEMRQAPFMLWINDLSTRDPFFVLPLLMGAAMFFQQKLNPAPADPVQARVMSILPVVFTVFFAFFPAGLVLYWLTNTLLSIAQQWRINKVVEAEGKAKKAAGR